MYNAKKKQTANSFFSRVYNIASQIPKGKIATYGQIAAMAGNPMAARAVGTAMQNTPEYVDIPCHRVVNRLGRMSPSYAFGGAEKQREMLENEGIVFLNNGCIDMKKCIWIVDIN